MDKVKLIVKYQYQKWDGNSKYNTFTRATIIECTPSVIDDDRIIKWISAYDPDAKHPILIDITKL